VKQLLFVRWCVVVESDGAYVVFCCCCFLKLFAVIVDGVRNGGMQTVGWIPARDLVMRTNCKSILKKQSAKIHFLKQYSRKHHTCGFVSVSLTLNYYFCSSFDLFFTLIEKADTTSCLFVRVCACALKPSVLPSPRQQRRGFFLLFVCFCEYCSSSKCCVLSPFIKKK